MHRHFDSSLRCTCLVCSAAATSSSDDAKVHLLHGVDVVASIACTGTPTALVGGRFVHPPQGSTKQTPPGTSALAVAFDDGSIACLGVEGASFRWRSLLDAGGPVIHTLATLPSCCCCAVPDAPAQASDALLLAGEFAGVKLLQVGSGDSGGGGGDGTTPLAAVHTSAWVLNMATHAHHGTTCGSGDCKVALVASDDSGNVGAWSIAATHSS